MSSWLPGSCKSPSQGNSTCNKGLGYETWVRVRQLACAQWEEWKQHACPASGTSMFTRLVTGWVRVASPWHPRSLCQCCQPPVKKMRFRIRLQTAVIKTEGEVGFPRMHVASCLTPRCRDRPNQPTPILCDNNSGHWFVPRLFHAHVKHIDICWHYIPPWTCRGCRSHSFSCPRCVNNTADVLTKPLSSSIFDRRLIFLGLRSSAWGAFLYYYFWWFSSSKSVEKATINTHTHHSRTWF